MVWIYVALGVSVLGLALLGWYVYVLFRKVSALMHELGVVADRAAQALDLLARIEVPDRLGGRYDASFPAEADRGGSPARAAAACSRREGVDYRATDVG